MDLRKAGIISNRNKDLGFEGAKAVAKALRDRGITVGFDKSSIPEGESLVADYADIDCLFVLGGDGTLLKAAHLTCSRGIPMLGVNLGRLGFLSEIEIGAIGKAADDILNGNFHTDKRLMLSCDVLKKSGAVLNVRALNDVAVLKKDIARTIFVKLSVNGVLADKYNCDGIIVSTPTGSTGYSLSAGGPVIDPALECMIATPVCPHSLHSRTIAVPAEYEIGIEPQSESGMALVADGSASADLCDGDLVNIRKSDDYAYFIRFGDKKYYPLLRSKFKDWIA